MELGYVRVSQWGVSRVIGHSPFPVSTIFIGDSSALLRRLLDCDFNSLWAQDFFWNLESELGSDAWF